MSDRTRPGTGRRLLVVGLFALAMAWLEAVVVVYIRTILGLAHGDPLPRGPEVMERIRAVPWLLPTEQGREAATIVMLASLAWLAGRGWRARLGAFLFAFGVWDIGYYLALYAHLRWPPSLATLDLLFLIPPHPWWYQPVWVPVTISVGLIAAGIALFRSPPPAR